MVSNLSQYIIYVTINSIHLYVQLSIKKFLLLLICPKKGCFLLLTFKENRNTLIVYHVVIITEGEVIMSNELIWAYHLRFGGGQSPFDVNDGGHCKKIVLPELFDIDMWKEMSQKLKDSKCCNTIIIEVANSLQFETHPEITGEGAWDKYRYAEEISRLKDMGFKVYPLLNFSAGHDDWMGIYSRMVSTPQYYTFCKDIIEEVSELFGKPELFHLGWDEECMSIQNKQRMCIIRNNDLYWHDINYTFSLAEKCGARPWIWADYVWHSKDKEKQFVENMSKEVLLSNWYYQLFNDAENDWHYGAYHGFDVLEKHGFDQLPSGSNICHEENFGLVADYCTKLIAPERLKGYMMCSWRSMCNQNKDKISSGIDDMKKTYDKYCSENK